MKLEEDGIDYRYEAVTVEWIPEPRKYIPDFILPNGVIIEAKGRFKTEDRARHVAIREQHPELDIRFVFQYDNPIRKGSDTRYSDWCDKHGFLYAIGEIPEEWVE